MPHPLAPRPEGEISVIPVHPLEDPEWDQFVAGHPDATVFHSAAWAQVLMETYHLHPHYLAVRSAGRLVAGLPIMEVTAMPFGRRGVSLPFTDACPALVEVPKVSSQAPQAGAGRDENGTSPSPRSVPLEDRHPLIRGAWDHGRRRRWKSLEMRDCPEWTDSSAPSLRYFGHTVRIEDGEGPIRARCSETVRRAIRKAERSGLRLLEGRDEALMRAYFALHCLTRRRHGLPPQPEEFFMAIQKRLLSRDLGSVVLVMKDQTPVAGAVFLRWGNRAMYKFGASDDRFQSLRPNNLVMWGALRSYQRRGCREMDLGRTALRNEGLRRFKLGWGSRERMISYTRVNLRSGKVVSLRGRETGWHTWIFRHLPEPMSRFIGNFAYRFAA